MPKAGRIFKPRSVSFPPSLLEEALERARNLGMPFSTYIQKCIERDLHERGSIVFEERRAGGGLRVAETPGVYRAHSSPARRGKRSKGVPT